FLQRDLNDAISASNDSALITAIDTAAETAIHAIADFVDFLGTREPGATDDFAIGSERFLGLLRSFELVDLSLEDLRAAGQADLERNRAALEEACRRIDSDASMRDVLDRIREDHP